MTFIRILKKHFNRTSIKQFHLSLSFILLISLFLLSSCKTPPETIRMYNLNLITSIDYTVSNNQASLPIETETRTLNKSNAHHTIDFLLLKNLIEDYETSLFEYRKDKKPLIPLNTSDINLPLTLDIVAHENTSTLRNYQIFFDDQTMEGFITGADHSVSIPTEAISQMLTTSFLAIAPVELDLPIVSLIPPTQTPGSTGETKVNTYNLEPIGTWNTLVYEGRYVNQSFDSRSSLTPILIQKDREPFTILFDGPISNKATLKIYADPQQETLLEEIELRFENNQASITMPTDNGLYYYTLECQWISPRNLESMRPDTNVTTETTETIETTEASKKTNSTETTEGSYGELSYTFQILLEQPEVFTLNKESYQPGDLVVVKGDFIDSDLDYTIDSNLYNEGLRFMKTTDGPVLLLPIMSSAAIQDYTITITDPSRNLADSTIDETTIKLTIPVIYKAFDEQYLETSSTTASLKTQENNDQLNEAFARGRVNGQIDKLWTGPFLQPVGGRISTEYGQIRYTNGSASSTRHSGIDFANPKGTLIASTQNGLVTLAEFLNITGNTLFIDHGMGIYSQYYHLETIYVNVGDQVTMGQAIAEVGTTGFSTGPHLHFSIYYNGIYLNPWKFFEEAPF